MFTRYPRSVLRHQLGHTTSVATFKGGVAMKRGNDAGLGPPSATAHQEVVIPSASGEVLAAARSRSRTPRRKPLRCFAAREIKEKVSGLAVRVVEKKSCTSHVIYTSVPSSAGWEFPPARLGAPGRKGYRRGSVQLVKQLHCVDDVAKAKADYEGDKYAKSAVESVQSRLLWWTARASEHCIEPYPLTVDKLQLFGALLKAAGYRSAVSCMSIAKKQHIKLGYLWTAALDLEMRDGKRACERSIGPPRKCGSFDLRKLASLQTTGAALFKGGPRWPREGALCGCWWAMREMELSSARCKQVTFYDGPGCGTCTFDLPVSKTDLQALGKRRTHTCACSGGAPGSDALCPVKVARTLYAAAFNFAPPGANPDPGMRPLWPSRRGQFATKRLATLTFQKLARLGGMDSRITGHVCRVTGAQAMAVAGIELWLIQAFCRWGSWAVFEYVRDCQLASATDVAVRVAKGLQLMEVRQSIYQRLEGGPQLQAASERVFEEALEETVQGVSVAGLQADQVKEQIQGRVLDAARVGPVRFVSCAEVGMGKAHVWKTDAVTWCGRRWVHMVTEVLPEMERCRRCLRAVAVGVSGGVVQVLDP